MTLATMAALWALPWAAATVGLVLASRRLGRLEAASWLLVVAAVVVASEDVALPFWQATASAAMDPQGMAEVAHPHVRGHMLTAAAWTAAACVLAAAVGRTALRRGERWAWRALLAVGVIGWGAHVAVAALLFSHGLPLPTPAGRVAGFGWQPIWVGAAAWAAALALSFGPVHGRRTRAGLRGG